jgi:hypothetical protein
MHNAKASIDPTATKLGIPFLCRRHGPKLNRAFPACLKMNRLD